MEVPGARRARGARGLHERVWPRPGRCARRGRLSPGRAPVFAPTRCPCRGGRAAPRPRAAPDDGNRVARELVLRPDAAPQEDRGREVRTRREHDGAGVDPLARRRSTPPARGPVQHQPVDERVGEHAQVRPRAGGVEVGESRVPARPLDDVRRKRRPADRLRGIVGVVEQWRPRHPPPRGTRRGAARARPCWRRRRGACRARGRGRARTPRTARRGPIRRSRRASRRPPCMRCGWSSRRSRGRRASGRPRRPCPSRA